MEEESSLHAKNRDFLSRTDLGSDKGTPNCDASAHHGSGVGGRDVVRNFESKVFVSSHVARVPSLRYGAVLIRCTVCV